MGRCDRVRLRLTDATPGGRHNRDGRLAETKPSVGLRRGMKRGRIGMSRDDVCAEKKQKVVAMAGFVKKRCLALMEALIEHPYGEVFRDLGTLASIPTHGAEFMKRLKKRMDLSKIMRSLEKGYYSAIEGFVGDIRLVFSNALMFFPVENDVHTLAKRMSRDFEVELEKAMSEIERNAGENVSAVISDSDQGSEKSVSRQRFNDSIKSPKTVLESTGAATQRAPLLKERFKETIQKTEKSLHGNGGEKKLKEMQIKRKREAARKALRKMEKSAKLNELDNEIDGHKAVKELEYLCGHPLTAYYGRQIKSRLGLFLKGRSFRA